MARLSQKATSTNNCSIYIEIVYVLGVYNDQSSRFDYSCNDLLFCNSGEARGFTNTHNTEAAAEQFKKYAKTFVITRGAGGSLSYGGTDLVKTLGVTANTVNSNGAGDVFAGAFLYAINAGRSYVWGEKFANEASASLVYEEIHSYIRKSNSYLISN